jgi:ankyrin repeat protein
MKNINFFILTLIFTTLPNSICHCIEKSIPLEIETDMAPDDVSSSWHDTIKSGNLQKIEQLLLRGPYYIDKQDKSGATALHLAVLCASKDIAEMLIKYGADPNIKDKDGNTALYSAASCGRREFVEILLSTGADPNIKNNSGGTALSSAVSPGYQNEEIAELLIKAGAVK